MLAFTFGVFLVLHSLVHLLYFGQSARLFELQPQMVWPDGSWAFSKLVNDKATRLLASISCLLAAIGFAVGGIGILVHQAWWHSVIVASTTLSTMLIILFWDGKTQKLDDKGAIGLLINLAILVALLALRWTALEFYTEISLKPVLF